jgi:outer membrane receptor protein involved in Fe transport
MYKSINRKNALLASAATLMATAIMGVSPVIAQDADVDASVEEVYVTGSRIKNPNISSPSPVTVIGAAEIDIRGTVLVEDLLSTLPMTFQADSTGDFGASGVASVDLRGLGANRTLVLVDGARLPFGASNSSAPDLNQIPAQMVERIEVLTGGASAVYGADAVSGVVNFVMKRNFEGVSIDGQMGIYQTGNKDDVGRARLENVGFEAPGSVLDGFSYNTSIIAGANFGGDRGNVTAYATYRNINSIVQKDRIGSACAVGGGDPVHFCLGSSTTNPARITNFGVGSGVNYDIIAYDRDTGQTRDFVGRGPVNDTFNFASTQRFQRPDERFTFGSFMYYQISDNAEVYLDTMFSNTKSESQIGPSGTFFRTSRLNCDNPLLSAAQLQAICTDSGLGPDDDAWAFIGRRNVEGGPRQTSYSNNTFRINGGLRGQLNDSWSYDLNGQYAAVNDLNIARNDLIVPNLKNALNVVADPDTGDAVCQSVLDGTDSNCVPYDLFNPGGVTQAALDYIMGPGFSTGSIAQRSVTATVEGNLGDYGFKSPGADSGVQLLAGFNYREDELARSADSIRAAGQLSGFGGATLPVAGALNVYEFFAEMAIPLVEGKEFAEEISATAAYRFSDYNTTGSADTYALGLVWAPTSDIKFRAQYQRATRSPNIFELFLEQNTGLFDITDTDGDGIFDPCGGATPSATAAQCANTGVTAAQYGNVADNPAGQFNLHTGGNPNLQAETSSTYTIGGILTPEAVPGLTISVDYFNIRVEDFVGTIPPELSLNNCLETGDAFFCNLVQRDSGGTLFADPTTSFVVATNVNTGQIDTSGIDINASYSFDLPGEIGGMNVSYTATYLMDLSTISVPGEAAFDCVGLYSGNCGSPNSEYKHSLLSTWSTTQGLDVSLTWRHIGDVRLDGVADDSTSLNASLGQKNYFDLSFSKSVTDSARIRLGINNLLDNNPPISGVVGAGFGNGNTYPGFYDARGRFAFVGFTLDY